MKSIFLYLRFIIFILGTLPKKSKVNSLKKQGRVEEADTLAYETLLKWANFTVDKAGIKLNIKGKENLLQENCLFVANHQGLLDIPVMVCAIDRMVGFIAKKELLKIKLISDWMKQIHCVFMDRSNVRESIKSINEGVEILKRGYNMAIFPEGTRSKGEKLGEFKKGSMKLALKSGVNIVPIAIDGTYNVLEANSGRVKAAEVTVSILKPIDINNLSRQEQQNLSDMIRGEIQKELEVIRISNES